MHDNVIHDTGADSNGNECEAALIGNPGETLYFYNNVLYNLHGNGLSFPQAGSSGVALYIWNNTLQGGGNGSDYSGYCIRVGGGAWTTIKVQNNYCASNAGFLESTPNATTYLNDHNTAQTKTTANAQGYNTSGTFAWYPPSGGITVNAGTDLSTNCTSTQTGLCTDTSYAVGETPDHHVITARTAVTRPQGGTWDTGAYER